MSFHIREWREMDHGRGNDMAVRTCDENKNEKNNNNKRMLYAVSLRWYIKKYFPFAKFLDICASLAFDCVHFYFCFALLSLRCHFISTSIFLCLVCLCRCLLRCLRLRSMYGIDGICALRISHDNFVVGFNSVYQALDRTVITLAYVQSIMARCVYCPFVRKWFFAFQSITTYTPYLCTSWPTWVRLLVLLFKMDKYASNIQTRYLLWYC